MYLILIKMIFFFSFFFWNFDEFANESKTDVNLRKYDPRSFVSIYLWPFYLWKFILKSLSIFIWFQVSIRILI